MSVAVISCTHCGRENPDEFRVCPECSFPLMLVAGKYRLSHIMAEGGMGRVYLAKHTLLDFDTERVIKVIKPEALEHESTLKRFRREVQLTAALSQKNEHIVRIYDDFGEEKGLGFYYVMEYLEGVTLRDWLQHEGALPVPLALSIFSQFCKAMGAAHSKGIIHRDLKPENLLLIERNGESHFVKVIDFGIARPGPGGTQSYLTKGMLGTPLYMSPEQSTDSELDTRSDIYSMGLILYEMLSGTNPFGFKASSQLLDILYTHMTQPPQPLAERFPTLAGFDPIFAKAMAKQADERYQTVEEFWNEIVELAPAEWRLQPMQVPSGQIPFARDSLNTPRLAQETPAHSLALSVGQLKEKVEKSSGVLALPTPSPVSGFTQRMAANEVHKHPTMGEHQSSDPAYHPTVLPPTEKAGYMIPEKYLKMMPWMIGLMVMLFFGMIGMMVMEYYEHENEHKEESVKKMAPRNP